MIAQDHLRQMPLVQKLALLEALWDELSSVPEQVEIPAWHKEILDEQLQAAERGDVEVFDWDVAKEKIRELTR